MLRAIHVQLPPAGEGEPEYPFAIPALQGVGKIPLDAPVVFLVGENGSGKSTLLEALAVATALPTVGSGPADRDPTLAGPALLAEHLRPSWSPKLTRGFFLRAEDVFGFILSLRAQRRELLAEMDATRERMRGASNHALGLALGPYLASIGQMDARYGKNPDARSHGETFLHLFRERIVPNGLYLLDEPEAALSPTSQLALVSLIDQAVRDGCQFVVATHSPLLLAIPDAVRLSFDRSPIAPVPWDELECGIGDSTALSRRGLSVSVSGFYRPGG